MNSFRKFIHDDDAISLSVFLLLLMGMSVVYGFQYSLPAAVAPLVFRCATIVFILGIGIVAFRSMSSPIERWYNEIDLNVVGLAFATLQLCLTIFFNFPTRPAIMGVVGVLAFSMLLLRWVGAARSLSVVIALAFVGYAVSLVLVPFEKVGGDMLPFIAHAVDSWRDGHNPYLADYSGITANPFFYLPIQWIVFLPFRLAALDMRVLNLICAAAVILIVEWAAKNKYRALRAGVYPILVGPVAFAMMHSGQVWPYWLAIISFALLLQSRQWILSALLVAIAISIRQTALIPAACCCCIVLRQASPRILIGCAAIAVIVCVGPILPFVYDSPAAFQMLFIDGPAIALHNAHLEGNPANQIALSNLFDRLGLGGGDTAIEAGIAVASFILAWTESRRSLRHAMMVAGLGYIAVISANPYVHAYYYSAGALLFVLGLTAGHHASDRQGPKRGEIAILAPTLVVEELA